MDGWAAVAASIAAAFADIEPIVYTQAGVTLPPIPAVRVEEPAPAFEGPGATLLKIAYEIQKVDLPAKPANGEILIHRGRRWRVQQVDDRDAVGAWLVNVTDAGAAQ